MDDDRLYGLLTRLMALSPEGEAGRNALVREVCARAVSLPPLVAQGRADEDPQLAEFAEQFAVDVSVISTEQRSAFLTALGSRAFRMVALIFVADFVPRVRAGLAALGFAPVVDPVVWDRDTDPVDLLLNQFAPTVGALRALDPVTTEVIRLRGAVAHNCRLCKSLREGAALDAGGSESLYCDIEDYESSALLDDRHKAALSFVDALIWTPSKIDPDVSVGVREHFSDSEAMELTFDVMRNAANKIAVALGVTRRAWRRAPSGTSWDWTASRCTAETHPRMFILDSVTAPRIARTSMGTRVVCVRGGQLRETGLMMRKTMITTVMIGGFAAAALGLAGTAAADAPAAETIAGLQAQGYSVQMNGGIGQPLSECTVSGVHGVSASNPGGTVYVDMACRGGC